LVWAAATVTEDKKQKQSEIEVLTAMTMQINTFWKVSQLSETAYVV
jgi:hypothetical protein